MQTTPDIMFSRVLLVILGLQKTVDALLSIFHPPTADAVLGALGLKDIAIQRPLDLLLGQLWGCASLAWAYFLLRGARDPQRNRIIMEGSALGFVALGLVAIFTPLPLVRAVGILFFTEAVLLLISRLRLDRARPASGGPA